MTARPFIAVGGARAAFLASRRLFVGDAQKLAGVLVAPGVLDDARTRADARETLEDLRRVARDALAAADSLSTALARSEAAR
jgi:hypothetical protein